MRFKKILFPSDFSTSEQEALNYAGELARENQALLLIVHVEEPATVYGDGTFYYGIPDPDRKEVNEMLQRVKPSDPSVRCERYLVVGNPGLELAALAEREKVDLIVMSSHGRTGLARLVLGSVAEAVMRNAPCPILIVKPKIKLRDDEGKGDRP
jgi:universal stress protein A